MSDEPDIEQGADQGDRPDEPELEPIEDDEDA